MASGTVKLPPLSLGATSSMTFPFTAPSDGFFVVTIRASTTGRLYANFTSFWIVDGYQASGGYIGGCRPVQKGTTIPSPSTSNVSNTEYRWIPLS